MNRSWPRLLFVIACGFAFVFAPLGGSAVSARQGFAAADPGVAPGWLVQRVDSPLTFTEPSQHSMRLDSAGYPRLAYGGDHLYYAYQDAGGWHTEVADGAWSVGRGASLALDSAGKAHISYYDAANRILKYATNKSGAWVTKMVGTRTGVGRYSDITIDSSGGPAIVYYDSSNEALRYIFYDSEYGGWGPNELIAVDLDDPGHTGWFSFALDTSVLPNKPHVSFFQTDSAISPTGDLYYAHYTSANAWVFDYIDSCEAPDECRAGEYNSIALDPVSKMPSVAYSYTFFSEPVLAYGAFNGTTWSFNIIDSAIPKYIALAIDSTSKAHVTYQYGGFKYLRQPGPGGDPWTSPYTIDATGGPGEGSSLAVFGVLAHVVHYDAVTGVLRFVDHERSGWLAPYTVATQGAKVGKCASLAVDGLGRSHISYFDETHGYLLYARYDGSTLAAKGNIDVSGTASCSSVMAVDPLTNNPVVGLVKGGNLYYAAYASNAWQAPILVDNITSLSYDGYQDFGLAVRPDGKAVFAYRRDDDLVMATRDGSGWTVGTVTSGITGKISLVLGSGGSPHILFYLGNQLSHAFTYGVGWKIEPVADAASNYYGAALAASQNGKLAAVFLASGGWKMHYAERTTTCDSLSKLCQWTAPVQVDEQCEEYFSLAMDRSGVPHAACMALLSQGMSLHYITRRGSSWSILEVDGGGSVGWYPSLALSPSGKPRISYYDQYNYDLKFALAWDTVYLPALRK